DRDPRQRLAHEGDLRDVQRREPLPLCVRLPAPGLRPAADDLGPAVRVGGGAPQDRRGKRDGPLRPRPGAPARPRRPSEADVRNGADAFVAELETCGTEVVFGNPGSTELAFLDAVGRSELEYVTCLHEGVAVGAAEGYARVGRRAGVVQLHTVAGVGNAAGMLANALAGRTPIVAFVGSPARADAWAEPVLGGDVAAVAAPVAKWVWELRTEAEIPAVVARAFKVALTPPF